VVPSTYYVLLLQVVVLASSPKVASLFGAASQSGLKLHHPYFFLALAAGCVVRVTRTSGDVGVIGVYGS
jgi:hypothetical protein